MNLPTQAQVLAVSRNIASFAAGAIGVFGLTSRIDPQAVINLVNSLGVLAYDLLAVIGIVTPIVTAWYASHSASDKSQIAAVQAMPQAQVVVSDAKLAEGIPGVRILDANKAVTITRIS